MSLNCLIRVCWQTELDDTKPCYQLIKTMTKFDDHNQQLDVITKITDFHSWACFYQDVQEKEIHSITDVLE